MQLFVTGLAGLTADEARKAKSLYIRNAISEYKMVKESYRSFGYAQLFFAIIPIFWPILLLQRSGMNSGLRMYEERITNALLVWKDDLGSEAIEIQQLLAAVQQQ